MQRRKFLTKLLTTTALVGLDSIVGIPLGIVPKEFYIKCTTVVDEADLLSESEQAELIMQVRDNWHQLASRLAQWEEARANFTRAYIEELQPAEVLYA